MSDGTVIGSLKVRAKAIPNGRNENAGYTFEVQAYTEHGWKFFAGDFDSRSEAEYFMSIGGGRA